MTQDTLEKKNKPMPYSKEEVKAQIGVIERFRLGKGISRENSEGVWLKEYVEVEVSMPDGATDKDFTANFLAAEYKIDTLLEAPKTAAPKETKTEKSQPRIVMTPDEINQLPWIASNWVRKDDPDRNAKEFEDGWIKREDADPRLIQMLVECHGEKLELPPYTIETKTFTDSGTTLIVRRGPKAKTKKKKTA